MQIAASHAHAIGHTRGHDDATHQFVGLLIVALFPALFWTAVAAGVGAAIGHAPTPAALMAFGATVAAFCALIGQALFSRN
jgi:Zn-dependent protease with chaperone function